ncbi:DUF262 domain-containing protein [Paenibacillus silvae]|uniref:DUF262 domain-containing protein n=1 Tax=Paenibacillus silvae TaxID=1325358 RepID=UPI002004DC58|nr:DUF262 domain-containing protein [Paenibacillus silvae]MCK6077561.1 DUF262 domain-containing HNH endonuclease family protein [Paenibacillus silvae]MCK6151706.1 DUF262 domain-containing HNH endonuclease family protein [Paenibacillus silvae]MCK6270193.1 DUF262 domain-containing HNH endonuclease family protein [Paenibacillus silvae]
MDVTPDKQNIDNLFSSKTYYIDFYQRQYKWTEEPVRTLLDDIFYKFNTEYRRYKDNGVELNKLLERYSWYYLNTYVTNSIDGKIYIVDGQQRLTTLTLILIKLYHAANAAGSGLKGWLSNKIAGQSGYQVEFWMNHEKHKTAMRGLFEGKSLENIDITSGITAVNMINNYKVISAMLDKELSDNKHKLESFIFYFLKRLVLINLNVEQTDVPMVFEVINDRGVKLKPFEILKGKLLGQIEKDELDKLGLNELWDAQISKINQYNDDKIDEFFVYFLRSKFAKTVGDARKFDRNYHRGIFLPEVELEFSLQHSSKSVKRFLLNEFHYYTELYCKILQYYVEPHKEYMSVYYNGLNEMDSQFQLILSACELNDGQEAEKIKLISQEVDRLYSLLQLQKSYDSNEFNEATYLIATEIRGQNIVTIKSVFDKYLLSMLSEARGVQTTQPISYSYFKDTGIELNKRFKRYFFARIEQFIADHTNMKMKHTFYDLVANTGSVNGFHIEHILSNNDKNLSAFGDDVERFERERNRLGGLLMLKGKDNISSSNELYQDKLKTYANTLYWNETLRQDSYKAKIDFSNMIRSYNLKFRHMDQFGPDELEERHMLLFSLIAIIWA